MNTRRRPKCWPTATRGNRDQPGWRVRVVPNKFPVLGIEGELNRQGEGMYDKMNGIGAHEVIIEGPEHDKTLGGMSEKHIEEVLWAFKERVNDLKKDHRFRYIILFKNHGDAAGASLEHPHSQLIALPVIPKRVKEEVDAAQALPRSQGALHLLRHHPPRNHCRGAPDQRDRPFHRARALRAALSRSRRGFCPSATNRISRIPTHPLSQTWPGSCEPPFANWKRCSSTRHTISSCTARRSRKDRWLTTTGTSRSFRNSPRSPASNGLPDFISIPLRRKNPRSFSGRRDSDSRPHPVASQGRGLI